MKHYKIETYISLLFCLVIMPLILLLAPVERWLMTNKVFLVVLVIYLYALYFTYKWAGIFNLVKQKKYWKIVLLMVCVVLVTYLFTRFPFEYPPGMPERNIVYRDYLRTKFIWFFFLLVTSFSLCMELTVQLFRQSMHQKEVESEKRMAELALYKAQINPHFMFNTLNSLYSMIVAKSDKTESAFIKFSNILKYMYSQTEKNTISIAEERDYIQQYIDLQSLRMSGTTHIDLDFRISDEQLQIPSMMLITFVENAFKYGASSSKESTIHIYLHEHDGIFEFGTDNEIVRRREDGKGIGIENCRKRLEALYPGQYSLETGEEDGMFHVKLKIHLKNE